MTLEAFKELVPRLLYREPFRPFTVVLDDGRQFEVDRSSAFGFRDGVGVFLSATKSFYWFNHKNVVSMDGTVSDPE